MYRNILALVITLILSYNTGDAQSNYPQQYFRSPVNIPISLAGNFGECRPGHFHMGLDIKTNGKENLPIYAAADGYISRIKMESGGFGHALYITHPNGYTTLYAHLNNFKPTLQKWLRQQQYTAENWEQDLQLSSTQFPVKKGEQIAWSGNTGGSSAPHLHFEIRDTKTERVLNPQLFGFDVVDNRPPLPTKIAVYSNPAQNFYKQQPTITNLIKRGDVYTTPTGDISVMGANAGLGIAVNDFMDGSTNTLAYYQVELYANDTFLQCITLNDIGYDETRYLNAYADYRMKQRGQGWLQLLFRLPGNKLSRIYQNPEVGGGIVGLGEDKPTAIKIVLKDVAGNSSTIAFMLTQTVGTGSSTPCVKELSPGGATEILRTDMGYGLTENAIYATFCESYSKKLDFKIISDRHQINDEAIPVHTYLKYSIKPSKLIPFALRNKVVMIAREGKDETGKAATPEFANYTSSFRNFGEFRLEIDTTAPVIKPLGTSEAWVKTRKINFTVKDGQTRVKSVRGMLDGKWILFEQHGSNWFYIFDEHCTPGRHRLVITASDESDNTSSATYVFTR